MPLKINLTGQKKQTNKINIKKKKKNCNQEPGNVRNEKVREDVYDTGCQSVCTIPVLPQRSALQNDEACKLARFVSSYQKLASV